MKKIEFTVVIPLYNKVESVIKTLESVIEQRFQAAEIIVIDDGSTDGSAELVRQLNIANLKLVKQSNQGVSAARNLGVSLASFPYIAFLDADDQWSPFFLSEMCNLITRFPKQEFFASHYQKVIGKGVYVDPKFALKNPSPSGSILDNYFEVASKGDLPFMVSSCVITSNLFEKVGGFPVGEAMGEDQELFSRIALMSQIVFSPLVLLLYHTDTENRACDRHVPEQALPFATRLIERAQNHTKDKKVQRDILRYCAAHICHLARVNIRAGNYMVAKRLLNIDICSLKPMHRVIFSLWARANIFRSHFNGFISRVFLPLNINLK